jgi:hypothetical protein
MDTSFTGSPVPETWSALPVQGYGNLVTIPLETAGTLDLK